MRQITVGVAGAIAIIIVACSGSDTAHEVNGRNANQSNAATPAPDGGLDAPPEAPRPPAPAPAPSPAPRCSASQGADACYECCDAKSPGGADAHDQAMRTCVCAPAACATECAQSFCAAAPEEPADGDACATCLADATECEAQAEAACAANAACAAFADCVEASQCDAEADAGM